MRNGVKKSSARSWMAINIDQTDKFTSFLYTVYEFKRFANLDGVELFDQPVEHRVQIEYVYQNWPVSYVVDHQIGFNGDWSWFQIPVVDCSRWCRRLNADVTSAAVVEAVVVTPKRVGEVDFTAALFTLEVLKGKPFLWTDLQNERIFVELLFVV